MQFFTLGQTNGGHIAPLVGPVEVDNGGLKMSWFSFGDMLEVPSEMTKFPELMTMHQGFTFSTTASMAQIRGMRAVILAKARPDL
jgi:hypothetical protein